MWLKSSSTRQEGVVEPWRRGWGDQCSGGESATGGVATGLGRILKFLGLPRQMERVCGEIGPWRSSGGLLLLPGARREQWIGGGGREIQRWLRKGGRLMQESDIGGTCAAGDFRD